MRRLRYFVSVTSGFREAAVIVEKAQVYAADIVVVGSNGRSGLDRLIVGSVAEKVVHLAPCDVLVARSRGVDARAPVLAALDLGESSRAVLEVAAREATARGQELYAAHALDSPYDVLPYGTRGARGFASGAPDPRGYVELRAHARAALERIAREANVTATPIVLDAAAGQEIVASAARLGAGLVVCGASAKSALGKVVLGSVATSIVRHTGCSVLVVK